MKSPRPKLIYPRRAKCKVHPKAHFLVRIAALRMAAELMNEFELCRIAGVPYGTWQRWKNRAAMPDLINIEAVLEALNLRLRVEEIDTPKRHRRDANAPIAKATP